MSEIEGTQTSLNIPCYTVSTWKSCKCFKHSKNKIKTKEKCSLEISNIKCNKLTRRQIDEINRRKKYFK